MFIEREGRAIGPDEWKRAVEAAGARLVDGTLHVELRDADGTWKRVITWDDGTAELSMMSYYRPLIAQLEAIAKALGARIIDDDGAVYF